MASDASDTRMDVERERALVARSRSDATAFAELYDFYLPRVYRFIARRTADRSMAEDLTAMTFERALATIKSGSFRNDSFGGWLYRVAANAVNDHGRQGRRLLPLFGRSRSSDGDLEGWAGADGAEMSDDRALAAFAATLDRDELRRAMLDLPEAHRRVLVLRFLDDLDPDELCAILGCSRGTLAVRLHRALRALRGAMLKAATDAA
jgi:RNA polymerase sigma-70 factor (ECF subfamily)